MDDNKLGLSARRALLEEMGHKPTAVSCPVDALEMFSAKPFDMVITDYRMPKLDGVVLIAKIREQNPDVPIILISGFAEALGLTEANTSADEVIQKSASEVQQLLRAVRRLLNRKPVRKPQTTQRSAAQKAKTKDAS